MFKKTFLPFIVITICFTLTGCISDSGTAGTDHKNNTELLISAASSLTDALSEIKEAYEKENTNTSLVCNFGGSGKLAQQIEQGAPVDVYISADQKWMDQLQEKSLLRQDNRFELISNQLVLIKEMNSSADISSLSEINSIDVEQIAIGDPASVPAGRYAKQALERVDQWGDIQPKLVYAKDVRQVLTYVETGNADIGIVYLSDALTTNHIKIIEEISEDLHTPILYPASVTAASKHRKEAQHFIEFLQSETAQDILIKYGFKKSE